MNSINFVWASPEMLDSIWQLETNCGTNWPHPKTYFAERLNSQRVLVALDGEQPIAYLVYVILWGNTPFIELCKVSPNSRRKGIAKNLVKTFEERMIKDGFRSYVTSTETKNALTTEALPAHGYTFINELNMAHGGEMFYLKKLLSQ
jgi:GNAT superfamily N-acetyltransferase